MRRLSFLISKYVVMAVLPYFLFTWLLLSVILFVQQAGRYSDLLFNTNLPGILIWQLTFALIPNVIAFTCPVAILIGVIIGLSRMQGDSEMVSLRAAGVGNFQISIPLIFLGILFSVFAIFINLKGVPFASQIVRQVALKATLFKLESPIDPGVFNSEINNFTIFVRKGNIETGRWEDIFIYQFDKKAEQVRLITSKEGRIDSTGEDSEIVLNKASVKTFEPGNDKKNVAETVEDFRLIVKTKRGELIRRISKSKETPEEMGLVELAEYIDSVEGLEKTEAHILWQRRILLSITPLIFALLGTALVTKYNRGGRGFGAFLSLVSLVIFYLLTLLGEQLARTGNISVSMAGLIPLFCSVVAICWFFLSNRLFINKNKSILSILKRSEPAETENKVGNKNFYIDFTTGILDFDIIYNLLKNYLLTIAFITTIYLIFTTFELWKFIGTIDNGLSLLSAYLLYLIPFIYIQLSPTALMIAALITYVIKSRQNEIVTWTAAGLSIYRLILPCLLLMISIGIINFGLNEIFITKTNRIQDTLRNQIRSRNKIIKQTSKVWKAGDNRIYSFRKKSASDNAIAAVKDLEIFEFNKDNTDLISYSKVSSARWERGEIRFLDKVKKIIWKEGIGRRIDDNSYSVNVSSNPFQSDISNPNHLNISETKLRIVQSNSIKEKRIYQISLQKKYSIPFIPLIIMLFSVPFALSIGRQRNVITIGYAIGIWLLFMGITNIFEQFGQSGFLSPTLAIWSPLVLFSIAGLYLLTKVRT